MERANGLVAPPVSRTVVNPLKSISLRTYVVRKWTSSVGVLTRSAMVATPCAQEE